MTERPIEITEVCLGAIHLTGTQLNAAMQEAGLRPDHLQAFPGNNISGAAVLGGTLNNDPTVASLIFVRLQITPQAQPVMTDSGEEMRQRAGLLALLRRYARYEPSLARHPQFWAALIHAEKGLPLSMVQRRILRAAWLSRARRFYPPLWRQARPVAGRAFMRTLASTAAFRHNGYMTTAVMPRIAAVDRQIVLGENFEGNLFDRLWPKPAPQMAISERLTGLRLGIGPVNKDRKRAMEIEGGQQLTADEFAAKRPMFVPHLTPSFTDTDSGDDGG